MGGGGGGSFQMMGETKFNSSRLGKLPVLSRILKMNLNKTKKKGGGFGGGSTKMRESLCPPNEN